MSFWNSEEPTKLLMSGVLNHFSCVWFFVTLWMVAHQAPLSMGFSRQEYWSGLPCPPSRDVPNLGIKSVSLTSPALAGGFFAASATWEAHPCVKLSSSGQPAQPFWNPDLIVPVWACPAGFLCCEEGSNPLSLGWQGFLWRGPCRHFFLSHAFRFSCPELPGPHLASWSVSLSYTCTVCFSPPGIPGPTLSASTPRLPLEPPLNDPPPASVIHVDPVDPEYLFCSPFMLGHSCSTAPITTDCTCLFNSLFLI